jgi:hypothetical protein
MAQPKNSQKTREFMGPARGGRVEASQEMRDPRGSVPRGFGGGAEEIRTPREIPGKTALPEPGGAKSGAPAADPDLTRILDAWPTLPEPIRRAILALIETAVPVACETP